MALSWMPVGDADSREAGDGASGAETGEMAEGGAGGEMAMGREEGSRETGGRREVRLMDMGREEGSRETGGQEGHEADGCQLGAEYVTTDSPVWDPG